MTGFEGLQDKPYSNDPVMQRALLSAVMRPVQGVSAVTPSTSGWQNTMHLLGKPEEITSKLIGQVFSDDPKYDGAFGSSDYWSQIGFYELAKDAGLNEDNFGTWGPALAATVGVAAAIANPLDPLNKLKIFGLTKKGVIGKKVLESGSNALVDVSRAGKVIKQFNKEALEKQVKDAEELLPKQSGKVKRYAKRSIKQRKQDLKKLDELNGVFADLQIKRGMSVDDIKLAPDSFNQARLGQRHVLGFGSPRTADHLTLLGLGKNSLDQRSSIGLQGETVAKLTQGMGKAVKAGGNAIKAPIVKVGESVLTKMGYNLTKSKRLKDATALIKQLNQAGLGSVAEMNELVTILRHKFDLSTEELLQVTSALDGVGQAERGILRKAIEASEGQASPLEFRKGKKVKRADEDSEIARRLVAGSRITSEQELVLTPSGLDDANDIPKAQAEFSNAESYPQWPLANGSEVTLTGDYVIIRPGSEAQAAADLKALNKHLGVRAYRKAKAADGSDILVARRTVGAVRMTSPEMFDQAHLDNLEVLLANLSKRQKTIKDLTPEDILVSPLGGVQIINPDIIIDMSGSAAARAQSYGALKMFVESRTMIALPQSGLELHFLKSADAAKRAPKVITARVARSGHDSDVMNVHDLLSESVNLGPEREILRGIGEGSSLDDIARITGDNRDILRTRGIEAEANKLLDQINKGETPIMEPVVLSRDPRGNLYMVDGSERAMAAALVGMDAVPVVVRKNLGETLDVTRGHYTGRTMGIREFWNFPGHASHVARNLTGNVRDLVSNDYRSVTYGTNRARYGRIASSRIFETESADGVLQALANLSVIGLRDGPRKAERPGLLLKALSEGIMETPHEAAAFISEMVASSRNHQEFAEKLQQTVSNLGNRNQLTKGVNSQKTLEIYNELQRAAGRNLEELASRGVLTRSTVNSRTHQDIYLKYSGTRTLTAIDEARDTLTFANSSLTTAELRKVAQSAFDTAGGAEEIAPLAKVSLRGKDGEELVEVSKLVTKPHPKIADTIDIPSEFRIGNEELTRLEHEHGIFRVIDSSDSVRNVADRKKLQSEQHQLFAGVPLIGVDEFGNKIRRPTIPFLVTRSGDVFYSTRHQDVEAMVGAMFGKGPAYLQESGIINANVGVIIDNPLGSILRKVGESEIRVLQRRIKTLAQKFEGMGLSKGMRFDVRVPFKEGSAWHRMYGESTTLGDVTKRGWKLEVPDELRNMPLDTTVETSERVYGVRTHRFTGNQQKLYDFLVENFDDDFIAEFEAGLSKTYRASYMPRMITQEASDWFNSRAAEVIKKFPKAFAHTEAFTKRRLFTDLTLQDVNDLTEIVRKNRDEGLAGEDLITAILDEGIARVQGKLSKDDAEHLVNMVGSMPSGIKFFHDDPLFARKLRFQASQRALTKAAQMKTLRESGAVFVGSPVQIGAMRAGKAPVEVFEKEIADLKEQLARVEGRIEGHKANPDVVSAELAEMEQERRRLFDELADKNIGLLGAHKAYVGKNGVAAADIDGKHIFIAGDDARRLVREGVLDSSLFPDGFDDTLVRVPFELEASALERTGIDMIAFTPEAAGVAQRLFGLEKKNNFQKFLKGFDYLQDIWRAYTLFPIPAYHMRNAFSNFFMGWLGGVNNRQAYADSFELMSVLRKRRGGTLNLAESVEVLESITYGSEIGQVINARDMLSEFHRRGGFAGGHYINEFSSFGTLKRADDATRAAVKHGNLVPVSEAAGSLVLDNKLIRGGLTVGSALESRFRMAAFMDTWKKTGSFDEAERTMKAIYYDYSDLSPFERDVMRRIIPFYSWSRHNIPTMLKTMATKPVVHFRVQQMLHRIEQGALDRQAPDPKGIPQYMKDAHGIILSQDDAGNYFIKAAEGLFPMFDAYKMLSGGVGDMIQQGITPFAKFPIEQLLNHSIFLDAPIEQFQGEPSRRGFSLGAIGATRRVSMSGPLSIGNILVNDSVVRDFLRLGNLGANLLDDIIDPKNWYNGEPTISIAIWDLVLGRGKMVDPERMRAVVQWKAKSYIRNLDKAIKYYKDNGMPWMINQVKERKLNFILEHGESK